MEENIYKTGTVVNIPIRDLYPHPDNPRKDLGDLTELADSIKANGVLQNLTVVPRTTIGEISGTVYDVGYTVVIGHRRLAAAKLAGLKELPCAITEMSLQDQVRTMLMENIQRADLTLYEQAQGFQMMLNMGDTVDDIARKSGFSQTTVRRRVKLLELDQDKFKAADERGANLMDYMEMEKISDIDLKNEVLDAIGTNNFKMKLSNAIEQEKNRAIIAERTAALSAFATEITEVDYSKLRYVKNYGCWDKKAVVERPEDADEVAYFYRVSRSQIDLYREKTETQEDEAAAAEKAKKEAEYNRREVGLREASAAAYRTRFDFIKNFSAPKKSASAIIKFTANAIMYGCDEPDCEMLADLLGLDIDLENEDFDMDAYHAALAERPEYVLLATAYAAMDGERNDYYQKRWRSGSYVVEWDENDILDFLYESLVDLGYEMSDEEKTLQDGTHELFQEAE